MARRVGLRHEAAERDADDDRLLDAERIAEAFHVVAPLGEVPGLRARRRCGPGRDGRSRSSCAMSASCENAGLYMVWSKPGPPCSSTSVGFSRMRGPSGTRPEPFDVEEQPRAVDGDVHLRRSRAAPRWRCASARRTRGGTPRRGSRRLRGSAHASGSRSRAAGATGCAPCRSTIRPGIDRDAFLQRRLIELHRVDVVGQLHPQEDAALRVVELGRGAELLVQRLHQRLDLRAQRLAQLRQVRGEMRRAVFGEHHLLDRAGAGIGLERQHARHDRPRRHQEADAQRRRDRLRERAAVDHVLRSCSSRRARAGAGRSRSGRNSSRPRRPATPYCSESRSSSARRASGMIVRGRVLHRRDGVDHLRLHAARLAVGERGRERIHAHAVLVERNADRR